PRDDGREGGPEPWDQPPPHVPAARDPALAGDGVDAHDEPDHDEPPPPDRAGAVGLPGRPTKRIGGHGAPRTASSPEASSDASGGAPGRPEVTPVHPGLPRPRPRGKRLIALAFFLVPVIALLWFISALFQPFAGKGEGRVSVTIPEGASVAQIGDILADEGVVDSGFFFRLRATISGEGAALRSGPHELREGMSYASAIAALSTPPPAAGAGEVIDVTIPEGLSRSEIAPLVDQAGVDGDYVEASLGQRGFSPEEDYGAPEEADSLEGFLFPSTYELTVEDNAEDLVSKQLEAFQENVAEVDMSRAEKRNLTPYEVLVIASMVERETRVPEERPLVAAVIYNRLSDGMPLGIDATIRYANENWDSPLKQSELTEDGPYNTRTRTGLPPTPIGNPGLASIQAAADPADEDYLYYVVKPGTCGEHNFSDSDGEFQRDVAEYNRARDAAGGKSPTTC
ncbi:MAG: endolytic transglycosylase MltG, partial [Actinobacteria bacterium]|nr:endolytic transglycosylase MltG [Actinomycetota bacterium]